MKEQYAIHGESWHITAEAEIQGSVATEVRWFGRSVLRGVEKPYEAFPEFQITLEEAGVKGIEAAMLILREGNADPTRRAHFALLSSLS